MALPELALVMSVREVADLLGLGRNLVYDMVADGTLRSVEAGRRILIPGQALAEFLGTPGGGHISEGGSLDPEDAAGMRIEGSSNA